MSLLDNPVGWTESRVGNRKIFFLLVMTQIVLGLIAIFVSRSGEFAAAMTFGILLFGIAYPCMYLYALKGVLAEYHNLQASQ